MDIKKPHVLFLSILIFSCGGGGGSTSLPSLDFSSTSGEVKVGTSISLTWSTTGVDYCVASGSWQGTRLTSGSESVTINKTGNNIFNLSCSNSEGTQISSYVVVEGFREVEGVIVDGYIKQALVFIDENGSFELDNFEKNTYSDMNGNFLLKQEDGADGVLVSVGGEDVDTGNLLTDFTMYREFPDHLNKNIVSPLTSIAVFLTNTNTANTLLGLDPSIDINTRDPVENMGDLGVFDFYYEKVTQVGLLAFSLQNFTNNINNTNLTTHNFYKIIAEQIENHFIANNNTHVDIEEKIFISNTLDQLIFDKNVLVSEETKEDLLEVLTSLVEVLGVKTSKEGTDAIYDFATSTYQEDIISLSSGVYVPSLIGKYENNILSYIAEDQDIDISELYINFIDPSTPPGVSPEGVPGSWTLIFSDEFNLDFVNKSKWNVCVSSKSRPPRTNLPPLDDWWWVKENVRLDNGKLILEGRKIDWNTMHVGCMNTRDKYEPTYGFLEAKIKIPDTSKSIMTALWLNSENMLNWGEPGEGTANDGAEIDVFETAWINDSTKSVVHVDGYHPDTHQANTKQWSAEGLHNGGFHIFGIKWSPDSLEIYYDGMLKTNYTNQKWIPHVKEYFIVSTGASFVDGDFKNQEKGLLSEAEVEYIRFFKESTQ